MWGLLYNAFYIILWKFLSVPEIEIEIVFCEYPELQYKYGETFPTKRQKLLQSAAEILSLEVDELYSKRLATFSLRSTFWFFPGFLLLWVWQETFSDLICFRSSFCVLASKATNKAYALLHFINYKLLLLHKMVFWSHGLNLYLWALSMCNCSLHFPVLDDFDWVFLIINGPLAKNHSDENILILPSIACK